jgi:hypothetical protein
VNAWSRGFLPASWTEGEGSAVVALYRAVRAPLDDYGTDPCCLDLGGVRVTLFWGTPSIPNVQTQFWFVEPDQMGWHVNQDGELQQTEGRYCLFAARVAGDATEADARAALEAARGVLQAYHGRNIAYMKLFELMVGLASPSITLSTEAVENPFCLPVPRLLPTELDSFAQVARRIDETTGSDRRRLDLSFRWFASAIPLSGPDAFLHYWIALEALAMPDSTNIRPVNRHLAHSYDIAVAEAVAEFRVGRLFGFRSAVVHDGSHEPVPGEVLRYVAALYADVLLDVLELPAERRARTEWQSSGPAVDEFLAIRDDV